MITINPFDFFVEESAKNFPFEYKEDLKKELKPYLKIEEKGKLLKDFLKQIDKKEKSIIDFLVEVNQLINSHINYTVRLEPGVQTCKTTLKNRLS